MTFFPDEYATKKDDEIILHNEDNKLDFRPRMLRLGTRSQNAIDARDNGRRDGDKTARKPVVSYINGEFERHHESLTSAAKYLQQNGHPRATKINVSHGIQNGGVRYGRTWVPA